MDVSVIIVNYNTRELTEACISSICQHTSGLTYEIVLADNDSRDDSVEFFSRDKRITFLECGGNLGFGSANNKALALCSGKYIFLLNSDTLLKDNAIKAMFDKMEFLGEEVAVLGTHLVNGDGGFCHSYSTFPSISKCIREVTGIYFHKDRHFEDSGYEGFVDYVTGADMFVRRSAIDKCGFFDSDFFMYFEDSNLQYRFTSAGERSFVFNGPRIVHLEGGSESKSDSAGHWIMYFTGMFTYMRKRYSLFKYLIFRIVAFLYLPILLKKSGSSKDFFRFLGLFFSVR